MAIREIWESKDVLLVAYSGTVTGPELLESSLKLSGDARFEDVRLFLADWSDIERVAISPEDIKQLVACLRSASRLCPHAKNASVIRMNDTSTALLGWYKFLADDLSWDVEVFQTEEEARTWYRNSRKTRKIKPEKN